jgi:Rrf2 family transcriptional regulator, cysteine metabolism repressor
VWISKRTDYATRVVLALAIDDGAGPISAEELARRVAAPPSVVEQVMPVLRTAGIVRSERGAHGGYRLNKAPEEIVLERVVRLFEGQLAPIGCATRSHPEPCPMSVECSLRFIWEDVRDRMIDALAGVTFADLAARAGGNWRPAVT